MAIRVPEDLPFADLAQTTCGWTNAIETGYGEGCLGYYSGGPEVIYKLEVTAETDVLVTLDPGGTYYAAIGMDEVCPPDSDCSFAVYSYGDVLSLGCQTLEPGSAHWIQVDSYAYAGCIAAFDLVVEECGAH